MAVIFDLCIGEQQQRITIKLLGNFNVSNALATAGVLLAMNYSFENIVASLQNLKSVPGRMEVIGTDSGAAKPLVIVDYAHTPDALEQALSAVQLHVRAANGSKIWCVFGCGGNRDKGKRKLMAEIACNYANQIILTNDNPRDEEPREIVRDIELGMKPGLSYQIELDRREAIKLAIRAAQVNDVILVAGKGHQSYQGVKGGRKHCSDQQVIQENMADM